MTTRARSFIVTGVLLLLAIAALRDLSRLGVASPWRTMYDFPDFYCAGQALDAGASPYTYEPLRTCEHRVNSGEAFRGPFFRVNPTLAIPAPLPAYDFAPFMAMARLPPYVASIVDATAILIAVALTAWALCALGLPFDLVAAALLLSTAYMELNTGQVVPFALLALAAAGLALAHRHDRLAGILAVLTAIEPSVGLPVVLATLFFVPRARPYVALALALFAVTALALVGAHALLQYAIEVLPAQAGSEVHFPFQYSLTYLLAHLGLSSPAARIAGAASYLLMLALGLALASSVSRRLARRELLLFIPALCITIGGTYLHPEELCFAIPGLLVLAFAARGSSRIILALAVCMLAIPWLIVWGSKQLFLASILICAIILLRLRVGVKVAVLSLLPIAAAIYALELHPPNLPTVTGSMGGYAPNDLVQNEWRSYAQGRSTADALWLLIKIPTWAALLAGLTVAIRFARTQTYSVSTG